MVIGWLLARETGGWPWPTSVGVEGLILSGEGFPDGLWCYVVCEGVCVARIRGRANHQWIDDLLAGTERIRPCLRHIGIRPD